MGRKTLGYPVWKGNWGPCQDEPVAGKAGCGPEGRYLGAVHHDAVGSLWLLLLPPCQITCRLSHPHEFWKMRTRSRCRALVEPGDRSPSSIRATSINLHDR